MHKLFFISTNALWSGSEVLWYEAACRFLKKNSSVSAATHYKHKCISEFQKQLFIYIELDNRKKMLPFIERAINKIFKIFVLKDPLKEALLAVQPDLVIISQGNDFGSLVIMKLCTQLNYKFVTVTQLVTELHWMYLNKTTYPLVKQLYNNAQRNYFVSSNNLHLHEFILSEHSNNNEVIFNPAVIQKELSNEFPDSSSLYKVAFVGRLECFHKGLDILLKVLVQEKWKKRPVVFNFYGSGPHLEFIIDIIEKLSISNVFIKGFTASVTEVWNDNHILLLPSRMEGQSLALLEALACGRTAIVTDVGGAREIIQDNITGFIAKAATISELEEAMERAWNQRHRWQEMGIAARVHMKEVMPEDPVSYFMNKLEDLLPKN